MLLLFPRDSSPLFRSHTYHGTKPMRLLLSCPRPSPRSFVISRSRTRRSACTQIILHLEQKRVHSSHRFFRKLWYGPSCLACALIIASCMPSIYHIMSSRCFALRSPSTLAVDSALAANMSSFALSRSSCISSDPPHSWSLITGNSVILSLSLEIQPTQLGVQGRRIYKQFPSGTEHILK
ncbi:hypothetical protein Plhal304r1_c004g0018421 [Plasmopara halstedii]